MADPVVNFYVADEKGQEHLIAVKSNGRISFINDLVKLLPVETRVINYNNEAGVYNIGDLKNKIEKR